MREDEIVSDLVRRSSILPAREGPAPALQKRQIMVPPPAHQDLYSTGGHTREQGLSFGKPVDFSP